MRRRSMSSSTARNASMFAWTSLKIATLIVGSPASVPHRLRSGAGGRAPDSAASQRASKRDREHEQEQSQVEPRDRPEPVQRAAEVRLLIDGEQERTDRKSE